MTTKRSAWETYAVQVRVADIWADFYVKARSESEAQEKAIKQAKRSGHFPSHLWSWLRAVI